jgi:hypothetical protein
MLFIDSEQVSARLVQLTGRTSLDIRTLFAHGRARLTYGTG